MEFGKKLSLLLWFSGDTNSELASKLNKNKSQISRWIKGTNIPGRDIIEKISQIYNVPYSWLSKIDYPIIIRNEDLKFAQHKYDFLDSYEIAKIQATLGKAEEQISELKKELSDLRSLIGGQSYFDFKRDEKWEEKN